MTVDAELATLGVMRGQGLDVGGAALEIHREGGMPSHDLAADLVGWFPPSKAGPRP